MIIVKLGGSLYQSSELKSCMDALKHLSRQQHLIVVPGGGPFADQVRDAQQTYQFNDSTAHHMAILAMAQFGLILSGVVPGCNTFSDPNDDVTDDASLNIWLPDGSLLLEQRLAHNWQITSDSLALWLAQQLKASRLILIKHRSNPEQCAITQLSQKNVLDQEFPDLYSQSPIPTEVLSIKELLNLDALPPIQPLSL